jgi:hypothetical protein
MDVQAALNKLANVINEEKKQLDNMLRGAQLLAEMLTTEKQSGNKERTFEYSEPGLEKAAGTGERNPI